MKLRFGKRGLKLGGWLSGLWHSEKRDQDKPARQRRNYEYKAPSLEAVLHQEGRLFGEKIYVISLKEFREALGEEWHKHWERALIIAENVVTRHLPTGANHYFRPDQDHFLMLFAHLPAEKRPAAAVALAQELGSKLIGAQFEQGGPQIRLAETDPESLINEDGSLDVAAVNDLAEAKAVRIKEDDDARPVHGDTPLAAATAAAAAAVLRSPDAAGKSISAEQWRALEHGGRSDQDPAWMHMARDKPQSPADQAMARKPPPPKEDNRLKGLKADLVFRPVWSAETEHIDTYVALPLARLGEETRAGEKAYRPGGEDVAAYRMDLAFATLFERAMARLREEGNPCRMILPMHFDTFASERLDVVFEVLHKIPLEVRASHLVVEVFAVPTNAKPQILHDTFEAVRQLTPAVAMRTRIKAPTTGLIANTRPTLAGFDLNELTADERNAERLPRLVGAYVRDAPLGLESYAWGAQQARELRALVGAGFAYVGGWALAKEVRKPRMPVAVPRERLIAEPKGG